MRKTMYTSVMSTCVHTMPFQKFIGLRISATNLVDLSPLRTFSPTDNKQGYSHPRTAVAEHQLQDACTMCACVITDPMGRMDTYVVDRREEWFRSRRKPEGGLECGRGGEGDGRCKGRRGERAVPRPCTEC